MEKIKSVFTKKVVIFGILFALGLCLLVLIFQVGIVPYINQGSAQKAKVVLTPVNLEVLTHVQVSPAASTPTAEILPGVVSLGMAVQVSGTGQDGLRMRAEPGTEADVLFLANEGENFIIVDGPVIQDSLIWWKIQSLQDAGKVGWSVQDFLAGVQP